MNEYKVWLRREPEPDLQVEQTFWAEDYEEALETARYVHPRSTIVGIELLTEETIGPKAEDGQDDPGPVPGLNETWEDYAHRLERRIKAQRDHIKGLTDVRENGNRAVRKRIGLLERALGQCQANAHKLKEQVDAMTQIIKERRGDE